MNLRLFDVASTTLLRLTLLLTLLPAALFPTTANASGPISGDVLARAREPAPELSAGDVEWTWLGIAGVRLRTKDATVLVDPYLTRASLLEIVSARVAPNEAVLDELLPEADAILIGHSHYDHLADAPHVATRTGALLLGSRTTCHLARALGALHCLTPRERRPLVVKEGVSVTRLEARHGEFGMLALFGGARSLHKQPEGAVHPLLGMPHGGPQAWLVEVDREGQPPLRAFVHTSAGLDPPSDDTLLDANADIAFVSASLAHDEERWAERITKALKPAGTLVLVHYESLWAPLSDDVPVNAAVPDLDGLVAAVKDARPDLTVVVPKAFQRHEM